MTTQEFIERANRGERLSSDDIPADLKRIAYWDTDWYLSIEDSQGNTVVESLEWPSDFPARVDGDFLKSKGFETI